MPGSLETWDIQSLSEPPFLKDIWGGEGRGGILSSLTPDFLSATLLSSSYVCDNALLNLAPDLFLYPSVTERDGYLLRAQSSPECTEVYIHYFNVLVFILFYIRAC